MVQIVGQAQCSQEGLGLRVAHRALREGRERGGRCSGGEECSIKPVCAKAAKAAASMVAVLLPPHPCLINQPQHSHRGHAPAAHLRLRRVKGRGGGHKVAGHRQPAVALGQQAPHLVLGRGTWSVEVGGGQLVSSKTQTHVWSKARATSHSNCLHSAPTGLTQWNPPPPRRPRWAAAHRAAAAQLGAAGSSARVLPAAQPATRGRTQTPAGPRHPESR